MKKNAEELETFAIEIYNRIVKKATKTGKEINPNVLRDLVADKISSRFFRGKFKKARTWATDFVAEHYHMGDKFQKPIKKG